VSDTPTPWKKALDYVEGLGLNSVHEAALKARMDLDDALTDLGNLRDERRDLEHKKHDREMEVLQEETTAHPDHSIAAMERHLKLRYHQDPILAGIRLRLVRIADDLDGLELDKQVAEVDIKIAVARLSELGGFFQFIAVIKQADEARKASEANSDDPWRTA
jgi:hypothetical protein